MSLTGHLDDPHSPVRRYLAKTFPHVRALRVTAAERSAGTVAPVGALVPDTTPFPAATILPAGLPTRPGEGYAWGTAGTAFDYRLRYLYGAADPEALVAASGARLAARFPAGPAARTDPGVLPTSVVWRELAAALPTRRVPHRPKAAPDDGLARLCVVLAWFEQLYRVGAAHLGDDHPIAGAGPEVTLPQILARVEDRMAADVEAMIRLLEARHPSLLGVDEVVPNPTFARSGDLGGADADVVLDGLLLEVKTTKAVTLATKVVWQLLGYLLADTDDAYNVDHVGLYFARHGLLWTWPVPWFLRRLAGSEIDLATARAEFARACRPRKPGRNLPTATVETPARVLRGASLPRAWPRVVVRPLPFYPRVGGRGMRHVLASQARPNEFGLRGVAPGTGPGEEEPGAACRPDLRLDLDSAPLVPEVGQARDAERMCRHCFWHAAREVMAAPPRVLRFFPARSDGARWHVPAQETGYFVRGDGTAPACSTPAHLDLTASPAVLDLSTGDGGGAADSDSRLCRVCIAALAH